MKQIKYTKVSWEEIVDITSTYPDWIQFLTTIFNCDETELKTFAEQGRVNRDPLGGFILLPSVTNKPPRLIILTGSSGCAKTTMMSYAKTFDGVDAVDTGDLFKALYALTYKSEMLYPLGILTGEEALSDFIIQNLVHGVALYERLKQEREITGNKIIYFIETLRALCPDLPSRWVRKYAEITKPKTLVTTAINEAELGYLINQFCVDTNIDTVALRCENPVVRQGDNRTPVEEHYCDRSYHYRLENSLEIMNEILFNFD
jgi:hypothetical protein